MPTLLTNSGPRLKRLLPRLRGKRMGVLGDMMLDRYLWGTSSRISPEAAVPVVDFGGKGVIAIVKRITTVKTRIIARHQQVVRVDHERREPLRQETLEKLLRLVIAALKQLDALVLSDYDKWLITDDFAVRVLSAAHQL